MRTPKTDVFDKLGSKVSSADGGNLDVRVATYHPYAGYARSADVGFLYFEDILNVKQHLQSRHANKL